MLTRILKPDLIEIVEGSALNVRSMTGSACCCSCGGRTDGCRRGGRGQSRCCGSGLSESPTNTQRKKNDFDGGEHVVAMHSPRVQGIGLYIAICFSCSLVGNPGDP